MPRVAKREADLKLTNVTVQYGAVRALDSVSLHVASGKILGVVGPNGAGKSTLIDAVSGFCPIEQGTVVIGSQDVTGWSAKRRARAGLARTFPQSRTVR